MLDVTSDKPQPFSFGNQLQNQETTHAQKLKKPIDGSFIQFEDMIIGKNKDGWIAYDRICDHNGGTLNLDPSKKTATCPIHKWSLNLDEGQYENKCPKKGLAVIESDDYLEVHRKKEQFARLDTTGLIDCAIDLQFNAHASITATIDGVRLTSDPWYLGSCFATGWWHLHPPSQEAIERLVASDFIYISHNHPDHLHVPTLVKYVSREKVIIVPNFESKSVESILRSLGYHNLIIADFLREIFIKTKSGNFSVVVVKSGDDRDDSSLIIMTRGNKVFLGVDTNMPNKWILPKVDVLYTPFAGGASGFPSRIDNFSVEQKINVARKNRLSLLQNHVVKLVNATKPRFVIPYAGYFTESYRDAEVKNLNVKNGPDFLVDFIETKFKGIKGVNPINHPHISVHNEEFAIHLAPEVPSYNIDEVYINNDVAEFCGDDWKIDDFFLNAVGQRFLKSTFFDSLSLIIIPSDQGINEPISSALVLDFSESNRSYSLIKLESYNFEYILESIENPNKNNIEILRVRGDSFFGAIRRGLPLEDLSIGFQMKMFRAPNVYNFRFWDHFTNREFIRV